MTGTLNHDYCNWYDFPNLKNACNKFVRKRIWPLIWGQEEFLALCVACVSDGEGSPQSSTCNPQTKFEKPFPNV